MDRLSIFVRPGKHGAACFLYPSVRKERETHAKKQGDDLLVLSARPAVPAHHVCDPVCRTVIMSFFQVESVTATTADWSFYGLGSPGSCFVFLKQEIILQSSLASKL